VIVHIILYKPKSNLSAETRDQILGGLAMAARAIPSIHRLRVGRRVTHGRPGYEQAMRTNFEYAVIVEFEDVEGLLAYLAHPAHGAIGSYFTTSSSEALAYDYELTDLMPPASAPEDEA
jgi:hypothetical protein